MCLLLSRLGAGHSPRGHEANAAQCQSMVLLKPHADEGGRGTDSGLHDGDRVCADPHSPVVHLPAGRLVRADRAVAAGASDTG
jgi:hypothetical protein